MKKRLASLLLALGFTFSLSAQTDTIPPTIHCKQNPITVNILPTGLISLWAGPDFYDTLYDNAGANIELGIRKVCTGVGFPEDTLVTYYAPGQFLAVEMWARDQAGNTSSCIAYVNVDGGEPNLLNISAFTEAGDGLEEANFVIRGYHCYYDSFLYAGNCCLPTPEPGSNFTITPYKNHNPLNGVTTYDLVLISKHILGIEPLLSPYKLIAADANYDGKITVFDIVILRRLILGITQTLPHGQSWRFIPKDYDFPDPQNPFVPPFPEKITVPFVPEFYFGTHQFVAVKIGDVNNTAVANGAMPPPDGH